MFKIWRLIYGEDLVELRIAVELPIVLERLRAGIYHSVLPFKTRPFLYGQVQDTQITVQYAVPFISNGFKPILFATCASEDGGTMIRGIYRCHRFTQVFVALWILLLLFYSVFAILNHAPLAGVFMPVLLMFGMLYAIASFGRWLARHDRVHIENMLRDIAVNPQV